MSQKNTEKLLFCSVTLNFVLVYIILHLRQEIALNAHISLRPPIDLDRDLEFIERKFGKGTYKKYPTPEKTLKDSTDSFFVDHGSYNPPKSMSEETAVLRKPDSCGKKTKLVIGIKSTIENKDRRKAIRNSWGDMSHYKKFGAKLVFLLGRDTTLGRSTTIKLTEEEMKYNDILLGDFDDSFHNLTYKDSMFFTWARFGCPYLAYIFKGDDDTLVNPFELETFIEKDNVTTAALWGCALGGQPVERSSTKYGDKLWPEDTYPRYVSGGGFLMNAKAMVRVQDMIKITPMIPIDDAFIGICMRRAGLEDNIYMDTRFKSWGFKPFDDQRFDVCKIRDVIYYHKFLPKEINCFWPKYIEHVGKCSDPSFKYEEDFPLCNPRNWYKNHQVQPPKLNDTEDYHHCGPDWDNAGCSTTPSDWTVRTPNNGPCCSPNGYCGITKDHCDCADCVDFRKIEKSKAQMEAHTHGVCCKKILIQTSMTYGGSYKINQDKDQKVIEDENGNPKYSIQSSDEKFSIAYGGFSVYGVGWYVLAPGGGGLAWELKSAGRCPPIGDWEGYGAVVSCLD